jgi:hypothetical protein
MCGVAPSEIRTDNHFESNQIGNPIHKFHPEDRKVGRFFIQGNECGG